MSNQFDGNGDVISAKPLFLVPYDETTPFNRHYIIDHR